jgi:hypothetical protein
VRVSLKPVVEDVGLVAMPMLEGLPSVGGNGLQPMARERRLRVRADAQEAAVDRQLPVEAV